jgi:hypothetical protein
LSTNYLRFVPTSPGFVPTADDAAAAEALLRAMLAAQPHSPGMPAAVVESLFHDEIEFVDPGMNFSGAECSACGADADGWWGDAMDEAGATRFTELHVRAGCCGARVDLNGLRYRWPAAFGRYVLEAEPFSSDELSAAQVALLGERLGCAVRLVVQRI